MTDIMQKILFSFFVGSSLFAILRIINKLKNPKMIAHVINQKRFNPKETKETISMGGIIKSVIASFSTGSFRYFHHKK